MAVNISELARQFGGVLENTKDQAIDLSELAKQFGGNIVEPDQEPAQTEAASVQPVPTTPGQGAGRSFQDLFGGPVTPQLAASYKAVSEPPLPAIYGELERQAIEEGKTSNVLVGGVSRTQDILGNLLEGVSRIPDAIPETAYTTSPILGGVKAGLTAVAPGLQGAAERFKKESGKVNYSYGTQLKELADNPLNVVPFVLERFAVSIPDMAAALFASPAYIVSLTNQTLNDRLKNDGRNFEDATVADVVAAGASAVLQSKLEKFATARFGRAETILGETAVQGGTEAIQEIGQYVAQTAGTKAGFDPTTAGLIGLEAGIAGGGIGLTFAGAQDFAQRRIEARVRGSEGLGSKIESNILDELRNQAFEKAKSISAPELNKIPIGAGQTEATPVQYGDAYAQKIYDTIGSYIPVDAEFKVEEKTTDGAPKFIVTDKTGTQYGQDLDSRDRADSLSLGLNNTTRGREEVIKKLEPLQSSLSDALKGFGLNDVGLNISNRIFTRRGKALTSEGLFDPIVRRIFLSVDAVDPQGNLDTNQRREALSGLLRHEVVHALRYLDLWKGSEWNNISTAAKNLKKPGTDKTYLQIAQENYADQNKVVQVEESVADLIRDVAGNISSVAGKPRNLSERAINFFDKSKNALTGAGFQTYEDVVRRFEQGAIGARERGRIRTFRATEELLAKQGQLPDRVQRLFETPQDRNQFRQETVQKVQQETPAVAVPAINSLRLNAVRESRSTIDPVPPMIAVDDKEVPTKDSEGRLIYSGYEGPEVFNTPTRPTMDGLRNFWNWFGSSKAVDNSKRPLVFYHGTAADITAFQPKQAGSVFLTRSPRFAEEFSALSQDYMVGNFPDFMSDEQVIDILNETLQRSSAFTPSLYDIMAKARDEAVAQVSAGKAIRPGLLKIFKDSAAGGRSSRYFDAIQKRLPSGANLMPVYVKAENSFDYDNKEHINRVLKKVREISPIDLDSGQIEQFKKGDWETIEGEDGNSPILDAIRELGYDSMFVEEGDQKNLAVFDPGQIKSAIGNNGDFSPLTPSIRESRVAKPQQILFEVAPDPNNQPLTEAWRGLDPSVRLTISERVAKNIVPMVLDASGARGTVVSQVGSYGEDTNPSFALMLERGDPLDIAKSIGFALSQDSMMVVAPKAFKGGDVVQSVTVTLNDKTPQEVAAIYDSLREIEVDGNKPVGGQTFANGFMTILNYSDVATDTLASLIDAKLNNEYNVLVRDVYSAFPEKKDYDYASPKNDGSGSRANLRKRLRDIRAEATDSVQGELEGLAAEGRAAAPEAAAITPAAREARRIPRSTVSIFTIPDERAKRELGLSPGRNLTRLIGERLNQRTLDTEGRIADDDVSDESARKIANAMVSEVEHQLGVTAETGTGIGWYSNNYPRALDILSRRFPELSTDPGSRSLFTALVAITSNGEDVNQNIANAITLYQAARSGQRISTLSVGTRRSDALQNNLDTLDSLVEDYGIDGFSSLLLEEMTVKEIKAELRRLGLSDKSDYTVDTVMPRSALYFGPKLGAFYANLMGSEGYLTMDLWWSRMFNRIRGTLIPKPTASLIQKVRGLLAGQGITATTDEDVIEAAVPFWESAKKKKYKNTTPIEKSSNTLIKSARLELEEAPFRASDRSFMIKTARLVQDSLKNKGVNLSLADIQAALWYYEKRLYGKLTGRATDDIGYEEAILKAAEADRPERSAPRFYRGRADRAVPQGAGAAFAQNVPAEEAVVRESRRPQEQLDQAIVPAAREARRRGTPIGPTQPGPTNDTDSTSAAEALNDGQPVDSIGTPIGPTISSTEPDGTVSIRDARIAPITRRLIAQMIQSAPDKLRSGLGLDDLAKRIENYYDIFDSRLGSVNGIIRDAFKRIDLGGKTAALTTFEEFIRARENGRKDDAQSILDMATDSERQLIDAWNKVAIQTGEINTSIRAPNGKHMQVWDAKDGKYRDIKSAPDFFPRTFRREVMEVMRNPDLDPVLWRSLLNSLVEAKLAENIKDAENYLLREWFSDEVAQDYFAGVEKARTAALPEIFYDYSWDAATRYLRKWARRTAQIENFGQSLQAGNFFQNEWFDENIKKVRDAKTQDYLDAIRKRIYEIEEFSIVTNMASWGGSVATLTMLGNPASASLNLFGGTITNIQQFGIKEIAKAYANLVLNWKNVQNEGTTLGILNKDFMNILNDHVEMNTDKYLGGQREKAYGFFLPSSEGVSRFINKSTNTMLTIGGFNLAENVVRAAAMLAAMSRINLFLKDVNNGLETDAVKRFREYIKREKLDIDALILENGSGKETERYLRRSVNVSQFSYRIDMAPVLFDTAAGRWFLKYQKFGTQVNRFFYKHFLLPFREKPTPRNLYRVLAFVGTGVIGGQAISIMREAIGYGDPGPDVDELDKALKNKDTAMAWDLILSRAWQNIIVSGSLGFFANYAQMSKDYQDQKSVKSPLSPPGLASIEAVGDALNRLRDQGKLTARDFDEIAETTLSFYRANKRIVLAAMDTIGSDAREVRRFAAQKELREILEYGRRYSEAMDIEYKRRTAPGAFASTPMTPVNKAIADALHQGDAARARLLVRKAVSGLSGKERDRVEASIRSSARSRQPIRIGSGAPSQDDRMRFLRWARTNLPAEKYQMILRSDRNYRLTANRANIRIGD